MATSITPITLNHPKFNVEAFLFEPSAPREDLVAIGTHGYTSSKTSLINWATRLSSEGVTTLIFDLPGHYLGSFQTIESFEDFTNHAHLLFELAWDRIGINAQKTILMGHSLGAFLSLKTISQGIFKNRETINFCVGLGIHAPDKPHLMETPLYKSTLDIRRQLVSPNLAPEKVFQWLRDQKDELEIQNKTICVINGQDDVVVGDGTQRLEKHLLNLGNIVVIEQPKNLAHHKPELAAPHIVSLLKKRFKIL